MFIGSNNLLRRLIEICNGSYVEEVIIQGTIKDSVRALFSIVLRYTILHQECDERDMYDTIERFLDSNISEPFLEGQAELIVWSVE